MHDLTTKAFKLLSIHAYDDIHRQHEFRIRLTFADNSLSMNEKAYVITLLTKAYDQEKIVLNSGKRRVCNNCKQECLATLFCEICVRNYLKTNFLNWSSENNDINNLIQNCQLETICPYSVIEWIPHNNLKNIEYLTKGGCSEIYTADWIGGEYYSWNSSKQQLIRSERELKVVLKVLDNVENVNQRWLEEARSHLTISNKNPDVVRCYGLTRDPSNGNYMLVMDKCATNLREYLQKNHNQLGWKERISIACKIIFIINCIYADNAIHRDLHSGNLLCSMEFPTPNWLVSDLGFCGPTDKPPKDPYGNLPYLAPEVISGKVTTIASDVYSIGMLMWEISSGQPPFINYEHDYDLALKIINGMRPKIVPGTPLKYENLMKQCWDADPSKRPEIYLLFSKMREINESDNQDMLQQTNSSNLENNVDNYETNYTSSNSKIHHFEGLPEPRNATEEEQEEYHSKSYDFNIPDNIEDFGNRNDISGTSKSSSNLEMEIDQDNYK